MIYLNPVQIKPKILICFRRNNNGFSAPKRETNKPTIQKKRIRVIGNNGVVETYVGRLTITNDASQCVTFEDEEGASHKILNQGGFIIIDYYNE